MEAAAAGVNLKSGFCVRSFGCQIRRFQLDISMGAFPRHRTCPFQNKSSHAEPFTEFYFPPILVFQNISLGNSNACKCNDWSTPPPHSLPSLCFEGVKSKSYGRVCPEPENNGIIFISLPPIKVPHKREKAPRSTSRRSLRTLTNRHALTTTQRVAFRIYPLNPHQSAIATVSRAQRGGGKQLKVSGKYWKTQV